MDGELETVGDGELTLGEERHEGDALGEKGRRSLRGSVSATDREHMVREKKISVPQPSTREPRS